MDKPDPVLSLISTRLASFSDTPALDASVLLANILGKPRTWVLAHPELHLSAEQQAWLDHSIIQLEHGDPFPYVLGKWEFFGLEFEVTPDVLIPRPETELLVEKAISWLQNNPTRVNAADIGTGSGAIAVSIAVNAPNAEILATDISDKALTVAKRNAEQHNVKNRIEFACCDLLPNQSSNANRKSKIDLFCANLPYIPTSTLNKLPIFGREPTVALDGGEDGLKIFRNLLNIIPEWLAPNALILLEIEATLGMQAAKLAKEKFPHANSTLHQDLTGRDRLLEIQT